MTEFRYPELDETVFREQLSNGLSLTVIPRKGFQRSIAYFVTDFGSVHMDFSVDGKAYSVPPGVAHYLEHKMFELPGGRDVSSEFALLGANVNAFTSYDMTAYYFSATRDLPECLRLLLEFVSTPWFPKESVEREIGIIDQEIDMNLDAPDSVVFDRLMELLYENHPVRIPILGSHQTIRRITPEILELCHRAFYAPGNMILCVIGDIEPDAVKSIALEVLGSQPRPVAEKLKRWPEAMAVRQPMTRCSMEVAMPMFSLAFKCEPTPMGTEGMRREMVADLAAEALFGESSELFLRLYEQGFINNSFGGGFETLDGAAMFTCSGDSHDPEAVRDAIIDEAARLVQTGIPEDAFLRMKRSALGRRIRGLDSFDGTCFRVCAYHLTGFDYFRFPELYRDIQGDELIRFLSENVALERCALSIIDPIKEELP